MKATIEFNLPADVDAYQDAVNGPKWKELARATYFVLMVWRDTEENRQCREIYEEVIKWYRSQLQGEGLTLASSLTMKQSRSRQMKFWSKRLDDYLKKSGIAEVMAECEKENSTHAGSKREKGKLKSHESKPGKPSDAASV